MTATRLPLRSEVPVEHTWDLSSLFRTDAEWEAAFVEWEQQVDGYGQFRGKLGDGPAVVVLNVEGRLGQKTPRPPRPMAEQIARLRGAL